MKIHTLVVFTMFLHIQVHGGVSHPVNRGGDTGGGSPTPPSPAVSGGYTMSAAPTNLIVGERVFVTWDAPSANLLTFLDKIIFVQKGASDADAFADKRTLLRGDDTFFTAERVGTNEFRYITWTGFRAAVSAPVVVRQPLEDPYRVRNFPSKGTAIIVFGDSYARGEGARAGNDLASRFARELRNPRVINAGVAGDTTTTALARLERDALSRDPEIVVVILGANNARRGISDGTTDKELEQIVVAIQGTGALVLLVGILDGALTSQQNMFRRISEKHGAVYVPNVMRDVWGHISLMSADFIHPDDDGYAIIADRILPALRALHVERGRVKVARKLNALELSWFSESDRTYRIVGTDDLRRPSRDWMSIAALPGNGRELRLELPALGAQQFFFVREE